MKYIIPACCLFLASFNSLACSCVPIRDLEERQELAYLESNLIFVGMVVSENKEENTYTMQIIELLKGDYTDTLVVGKNFPNGCSMWPEEGVPWLVYTNIGEDKIINIELCSLSRGFEFPYLMHESAEVPPPPARELKYDKHPVEWMFDLAIRATAYKRKALEVMQEEIKKIRAGY